MKMKLRHYGALFMALIALGFFGCKSGTEPEPGTEPDTFTVSFDKNAGADAVTNMPAAIPNVTSGGKITQPATNPDRTGYTFGGWYKEQGCANAWNFGTDTVTANITLYAKWTQNNPGTFTVSFDKNAGEDAVTNMPAAIPNVTSGTTISAPQTNPGRADYTFGGWFKEQGCANAWNFGTDTVTANITLYAKWTANLPGTFTVSFNKNAGEDAVTDMPVAIPNVASGTKITEPTEIPQRYDYTFAGWYTAQDALWDFSSDEVTANITLYAHWTPGPHTVTFNSMGGSDVAPINNAVHDHPIAEPEEPTLAGYSFEGWYTEEEYDYKWDFDLDPVIKSITLYAKWEELPEGVQVVYYWLGQEDDIASSVGALTLTSISDSVSFTAQGDGYAVTQSRVNGIDDSANIASDTYTFSAEGRPNGYYLVTLIIEKAGRIYSKEFTVTVDR